MRAVDRTLTNNEWEVRAIAIYGAAAVDYLRVRAESFGGEEFARRMPEWSVGERRD